MRFMESYKRLDALCRDMFGGDAGVTAYIQEMEKDGYLVSSIPNWQADYQQLKRLRTIRNRIAHEYGAGEELVSDGDADWVENFHQRILQRTDPLAQYQKMREARARRVVRQPVVRSVPIVTPTAYTPSPAYKPKKKGRIFGGILVGLVLVGLLAALLFWSSDIQHFLNAFF